MGNVWVWLLAGPIQWNKPNVTFRSVFQNPVTYIVVSCTVKTFRYKNVKSVYHKDINFHICSHSAAMLIVTASNNPGKDFWFNCGLPVETGWCVAQWFLLIGAAIICFHVKAVQNIAI